MCWSRRVPLVLQRRAVICLIPISLLAARSGSGQIGRKRAPSRGERGPQRFADEMRRFLVADGAGDSDRDGDRLLRSGRDKYDGQGHRHDRGCASVKPCGGRRKVGEGSAGGAREGDDWTVVGRAARGVRRIDGLLEATAMRWRLAAVWCWGPRRWVNVGVQLSREEHDSERDRVAVGGRGRGG